MRRKPIATRCGLLVVVLAVAGLLLAACGGSGTAEVEEPATIEEIEGSDVARLTLTEKAAERLDIQTTVVETDGDQTSIPYAAVLYDREGVTWTFTNPEGLVYVRESITVDRIEGDTAFLTAGPATGTPVVIVGVAELWGTELGIE